jgi:hypothetical protein
MIQGSCLCGGIEFEIDEQHILIINNCLCTYCQKSSGSAFATSVQILGPHFRWLSGRELVSTFESSPGNHRAFCKVCGSGAPQSADWIGLVTVPAGALDGDPVARPVINIFAESKAPWYEPDRSIASVQGFGSEEFWRSFEPGRAYLGWVESQR